MAPPPTVARVIRAGNEDVTADEASGQTEGTCCFHHKHGEVPATAAPGPQRYSWILHALLAASGVNKILLDGESHAAQQAHGSGIPDGSRNCFTQCFMSSLG